MADYLLIWAVLCMGIAAVLFLLEVFVPSGGILGTASAVALVAGIVMLFVEDTLYGLIGAIVSLAALPFLFMLALKLFPHTPIFRLLSLPEEQAKAEDARALERGHDVNGAAESLVGVEGKALTDLRPVGTCLIHGRRRECLSTRGVIPAGSRIKVVQADGMQIKVSPPDN